MDLDRNIVREWRALDLWLRPLLAELGVVAFLATVIFAVIAAVAEFLQPGFVVNYISVRSIAAAVVLSGGLALLGRGSPKVRSCRRRLTYAATGVLAALTSFWASWYYFYPVPEVRTKLALAAGAIIAAVFWTAGRPDDRQEPEK